jgi:hypothetical protein
MGSGHFFIILKIFKFYEDIDLFKMKHIYFKKVVVFLYKNIIFKNENLAKYIFWFNLPCLNPILL